MVGNITSQKDSFAAGIRPDDSELKLSKDKFGKNGNRNAMSSDRTRGQSSLFLLMTKLEIHSF